MKIAMIDPSLFTWPYDKALVAGLHSNGHDVALFGKSLPWQENVTKPDFLREHFYRAISGTFIQTLPRPLFRGAKGFCHMIDMKRLQAELSQFRPDVIHFQWLPLPIFDCKIVSQLRRLAPVVLTVHDITPFNGAPGSKLQSLGALDAFRHFDALIVHTDKGREIVESHLGDSGRVKQVAHGLLHEDEMSKPQDEERETHPENNLTTFLLFGKIKPYKGLDTLIQAVSFMDQKVRNRCRIRVVGKAYMDLVPLQKLANQLGIEDNIEYDLRFVSSNELESIFHDSDVMLFPYREIEASGVLMTAIANGKPVIATRMGSAAELFAEGHGGILIPRDDPMALANAMTRFIEEPGLITSASIAVRRLKDSIPSWHDIAYKTASIYEAARNNWSSRLQPITSMYPGTNPS